MCEALDWRLAPGEGVQPVPVPEGAKSRVGDVGFFQRNFRSRKAACQMPTRIFSDFFSTNSLAGAPVYWANKVDFPGREGEAPAELPASPARQEPRPPASGTDSPSGRAGPVV